MKLFNNQKTVVAYALLCAIGFSVFLWASVSNYRLWGDDNQTKEEAVTRGSSRTNSFYHK